MNDFDISKNDLLTIEDICKKLSISKSTLDRLRGISKKNEILMMYDFPEPLLYIGKSPRWSVQQINSWIQRISKVNIPNLKS